MGRRAEGDMARLLVSMMGVLLVLLLCRVRACMGRPRQRKGGRAYGQSPSKVLPEPAACEGAPLVRRPSAEDVLRDPWVRG